MSAKRRSSRTRSGDKSDDFQKNKKITDDSYWSNNAWMQTLAVNFFRKPSDHDYCYKTDTEETENVHQTEIFRTGFTELHIQSCVEIQHEEESLILNYDSTDVTTDGESTLLEDVEDEEMECVEIMNRGELEHNYCFNKEILDFNINDLEIQDYVELTLHDEEESSLHEIENQPTFISELTEDSGIVSDFALTENEDSSFEDLFLADRLRTLKESSRTDKSEVTEKKSFTKKSGSARKSREILVSEESPVIEGDFERTRRVTRLLVKTSKVDKTVKCKIDNIPGKLVWGCFRSLWWPAIIIKAEDAGMFSTPGKIWISWIGEQHISELTEKNVEPFSSNLASRLEGLTVNSKTKPTVKKIKEEACFKTIQMLKKHFSGGALVKPYSSWMKTNILPHKEKLDELLFYPYPECLVEILDGLKKVNSEKTEKYLRQQEQDRITKEAETKNPTKKVLEKPEKPIEEGGINIMDQKPGMIVWAKIAGYNLWPCIIMCYQHLNRKQPNVAHQWVMWYGDYKYSQVEYKQIFTFPTGIEKMEVKIRKMNDDLFSKGVLQASKDYCERLGYFTESWDLNYVIKLFFKSRNRSELINAGLNEPNEEDLYPQSIKKQLRVQINNQPIIGERKMKILNCQNLKSAETGKLSMEKLCITCFETKELEEHPFFNASLCSNCMDEFKCKIFAYGTDGKCFYCTMCGGEDSVAMCDNMNCPRVFCTTCIESIICPEFFEEILQKQPWYCFLCEPGSVMMKNSEVKIRDDWRKKILSLYRVSCNDEMLTNFERFDCKKKIRVLSLFDGIGTGLFVLKKLNIHVDCYYASEIDEDSMQVTFFNHGHDVIQLGDVRNIDEKKIKEIAPIDLLIGGSPCNELSMANPKRRGLDDPAGTGVLFYDYCRIKKLIMKHNKKRHLFWLFENVASMPKMYRNQISENLGREPTFIDSADFSAQHRPRLFWGNLPWGPYQANDVTLQDVLRKQCNRQALVKKIMTVTTRSNSLNQTKANLKPVLMDGKKDSLWVTELEEIFGFPQHYTDANLQKTRRLQLIGKAWSVQTLMAILRPIFYF